jgi:hypothetical protein
MRFYGIDPEHDRPRIQALRAEPPGLAGVNKARRRVFGSALAQLDELLQAAASVGPSVSPIPLYYALTQAGRAIAAVTLNEIWAAIPQLEQVAGLGPGATPAVTLATRTAVDGLALSVTIAGAVAADLPDDRQQAEEVLRNRLAVYPGVTDGLTIREPFPPPMIGAVEPLLEVEWRSSDGSLRAIEPIAPGLGPPGSGSYFWPGLGGNNEVLAPLASWWILLLALSSVARYEPDAWLAALSRDDSLLAIPIEEALDIALEMLPWFVLHALRRSD